MMKKRFRTHIILLATGIFLFAGCDKFLEENPDNRVELNTVEKTAQLLTNAYSNAGYTFTEWMSDNVSFTFGTQKLVQHNQAYTWEEITDINQDTPTNFWSSTYDAIAHAQLPVRRRPASRGSNTLGGFCQRAGIDRPRAGM